MNARKVSQAVSRDFRDDISRCMIRDRFSITRQLKQNRGNHSRILERIRQSQAIASKRHELTPAPSFPDTLPITARLADIRSALDGHQVVIVAGETGSGKTTQLPKLCLAMGRGEFGTIGHTQPRRVAARTVAARIAEELEGQLGQVVGYQVRFMDQTNSHTLVKVMTDGILLAETQHDKFLEGYDTLIIDEAHERSLNIDFLLGYLKRILPKRPDLKIIVTSATIDVERFSRHFNNAPIINVEGRTYPVQVEYRPIEVQGEGSRDTDEQVQDGIIAVLGEIERSEKAATSRGVCDVLVFLPGEREIRDVAALLRKENLRDTEILPLYSRLSNREQNRVFQSHRGRRIILSTNVAETSLTVPGIRYVIDPGLARMSRYSVRSKVQQLPIERVSQASANQRKGRCGRVSAGVCFRLYSEEDFFNRPEFTEPEILRTNLASVILQMLSLRLGDMSRFPFLEKPEQRQVNDGFHLLKELRAVDEKREITRLGRDMARFPIDLKLARMLLQASQEFSLTEVLIIVSALAIQDPRDRPHEHQQKSDEYHRRFWDEQSDFLAYLKLWHFFEEHRQSLGQNQLRRFCKDNFLSYLRMREWRETHRQLRLLTQEMKLNENQQEADYASIHKALLSGLLGNIGEKHSEHEYLGARGRRHHIFPGSSQFKKKPRWIMSGELTETNRLYGRTVAMLDNSWVEPLAAHLVSRTFHDPHFEAKRGQVLARERVTLYGLVVVKNRKADFGAVDPRAARHLFIQSALVEGELRTKAAFFKHNRQLVLEIEQMESKTRRRDILVDDQTLFQFYDARLPSNVCSQFDLEQYLKEVRKTPQKLFMTREALMTSEIELSRADYPDQLDLVDSRLPLDYLFDPDHVEDGISVTLPVGLLNQVSVARVDWLIPGLLRDKCLALVKSLPKSVRKHFVPAPDYVDRALEQLTYDGRSLTEALGERLFRLTGTRVPADAWNLDVIDDHLKMHIRVVDGSGQVLASGRNIEKLRSECGTAVAESFDSASSHQLEQSGLTDWTFGSLPEQVELQHGKLKVQGYPALLDNVQSVAIKIIDNRADADKLSQDGLLRLVMLRLKDQVKYVRKNVPRFDRFALYYATRGSKDELLTDIVEGVFRYVFIHGQSMPRSRQEFESLVARRGGLMDMLNEMADLLGQSLHSAHLISTEINTLEQRAGSNAFALNIKDIRHQLDLLFAPGFLKSTPIDWLQQYPRYLKAIEFRIDKLQGNLERYNEAVVDISGWVKELERLRQELSQVQQSEVDAFRWMLEEYRVSCFAQPIGTRYPISRKRLQKALNQLTAPAGL